MSIFANGAAGIGNSPSPSILFSRQSVVLNAPPPTISFQAIYTIKARKPDLAITERISTKTDALYRLNADMHPIHRDPSYDAYCWVWEATTWIVRTRVYDANYPAEI
jgi:hypothetical protein